MSATFVGMPAFPKAARSALANEQLRSNLAQATSTIRAKRARVVAELEHWDALRVRARRSRIRRSGRSIRTWFSWRTR